MPNLRQLEYLVAIADTLHFRRAAERCVTTQPTLSEQLKALEGKLGVQLVERNRNRVVMTPVGLQIVEVARRVLVDVSEIRALASSGGRELSGLLRLGLPPTIGPYLLPHVLPALHKAHPDLKLYIRESPPSALPGALEDGALDVVITMLPVQAAEFESTFLFREPLVLAVGADHPFASLGIVERDSLAGQDVLALGKGHQLHDAVQSLCLELGARIRYEFEGTSLDTLREMVVMGLGITFLPGLYARREIVSDPNIRLLAIRGRAVHRAVGMVWRKTSAQQASYRKLAEFFKSAITDQFGDLTLGH
ncbi:MAG: LysR substrate-binding domain-containing protein [Hyphomicrobiaceae bacterium]|nr:LysR substrate-binding domain-containing protein [Hyphomicrobiaceae bacterium]